MTLRTDLSPVRPITSVRYCFPSSLVSSLPFLLLFHWRGGLRRPLYSQGGGSGGVRLRVNLPPAPQIRKPFKQEKIGENGTWVNGRFVRN